MHVDTDAEVLRLQEGLRDVVALSAMPAAWIGSEPSAVAAGLADALVGLLALDFAFVRLSDPGGAGAVEITRGTAWATFPEWLDSRLATRVPFPRKEMVPDIGDDSPRRRFVVPVGVNGEGGVVAAASERSDFPTPMDQLLLSLAANHAAAAFQGARLVRERKRAEEALRTARDGLEMKVAERTAELHAANDELSALRLVATLVARGVDPAEIFSAVCQELGRLFGTELTSIGRFDLDPPTLVAVALGKGMEGVQVGSRWELDDALASTRVFRTGRSERVETRDLESATEPLAQTLARLGVVSTVATPIIVERRVWGAMTVSSKNEPLPADTEPRLTRFAELAATAIANADGRSELAASRRRIVAASDEARRRIERDLHDGTQQRLVTLGLALRAAEADAPADMGDLRAGLSRIATGLGDAVEELRELSRGIHPAILSEGGLAPALRTLARRSTIPAELDITTDARLPEPVEVAAYYVTSEALANATKHAQASRLEISLSVRNGRLLLAVRDDGIGDAEPERGSGLVGLMDRVEALGGSIRVTSPPGQGTDLAVELPVELETAGNPDPRLD